MRWANTNQHDLGNAREAVRLSALAYEEDTGADIRWNDGKTGTQAFGWVSKNQVVIVFRGTSSLKDVKEDLKIRTVPLGSSGKVHRGFLESVDSVIYGIRRWLGEVRVSQPIFVCGHSLGAAEACILAYRLSLVGINVKAVYTFGCPRIGDRRFARNFDERVRHYRYVNHNDIVTRLPPWGRQTGFRYYFNRHGKRVVIGWWGERYDRLKGRLSQSVFDGVNDHAISGYIKNLG